MAPPNATYAGGTWRAWRPVRRWRLLGPAYFTVAVRWVAWLMALAIVLLHGPPRYELATAWPFLLLGALQNALFTAYYPLLHRPLRPLRRAALLRRLDDRLLYTAADFLLAQAALVATGGFHSPFLVYSLTTLMFPAIVFGPRGALVAATAYAACRLLAVVLSPGGLAAVANAGDVDSLISALGNAYLIALFSAYLAGLVRRVEAERRRTVAAWRETGALYAVAQSILESPPEADALYARTVAAVRRRLRLQRFGVYAVEAGEPRLAAGYGLPADEALPAHGARAPLVLDGATVGWLVGSARGGGAPQAEAWLRALAAQLALGLRNAALVRERAELAASGERARLAREIHDGVAQSLYMLALNLEACADAAAEPDGLRPRLQQLLALARQALWEVRHYIFDLKPLLGDEAPLAELLRNPLREFQTIARLPAELRTVGTERPLPVRARAAVYRVLQEALANAFKHAQATRVDVELCWQADALILTVVDDGRGFDPAAVPGGHGLGNLRQRAAEVGGTAAITACPGQGTRVELRVPYAACASLTPAPSQSPSPPALSQEERGPAAALSPRPLGEGLGVRASARAGTDA